MKRSLTVLTLVISILSLSSLSLAQPVSHPAEQITGGEFSDDYRFTGVAYFGDAAAGIFGTSSRLTLTDPDGAGTLHIRNGRVGIGQTSPDAPLDLGNGYIALENSDGTYYLGGGNTPDSGSTGVHLEAGSNPSSGSPLFVVESSGGSQRLRVEHNGETSTSNDFRVGGTLHVDGGTECSSDQYIGGDGNCKNDDSGGTHHDDPGDHSAGSTIDANGNDIVDVNNLKAPNGGICVDSDGGCGVPRAGAVRTAYLYDTNSVNGIQVRSVMDLNDNNIRDVNTIRADGISADVIADSYDSNSRVRVQDDLYVDADLDVTGNKNFVQEINETHSVVYTTTESGEAHVTWTDSAVATEEGTPVEFPNHLSLVMSGEEDYQVIATSVDSLAQVGVFEKGEDGFVLKASEETEVDFRVIGTRKGYEDKEIVREK